MSAGRGEELCGKFRCPIGAASAPATEAASSSFPSASAWTGVHSEASQTPHSIRGGLAESQRVAEDSTADATERFLDQAAGAHRND